MMTQGNPHGGNVKQIEQVPTAKLIPYANNSRTHSPEQVAQLAASIREFGFTNPVLVADDLTIIAGHGRVRAAQALELEEVPVIKLSHLDERQRRAYVIADNRLALNAGWDSELLALEYAALRDEGFDLSLLGADEDEISALIGFDVGESSPEEAFASLPDGDRAPFRQMTFTVHDSQHEDITAALKMVEGAEEISGNRNADALHAIVREWMEVRGE